MYGVFVIKDEKNLNYGTPLFFRTVQDLRRSIAMAMRRDPTLSFVNFPSDFSVWFVGDWDELAGEFKLSPDKEHVCSMLEILEIARAIQPEPNGHLAQEVGKK